MLSTGTVRVSQTLPKLHHLLYLHWSSSATFSIHQITEVPLKSPATGMTFDQLRKTAQLPPADLSVSPSVKSTCTSFGVFLPHVFNKVVQLLAVQLWRCEQNRGHWRKQDSCRWDLHCRDFAPFSLQWWAMTESWWSLLKPSTWLTGDFYPASVSTAPWGNEGRRKIHVFWPKPAGIWGGSWSVCLWMMLMPIWYFLGSCFWFFPLTTQTVVQRGKRNIFSMQWLLNVSLIKKKKNSISYKQTTPAGAETFLQRLQKG